MRCRKLIESVSVHGAMLQVKGQRLNGDRSKEGNRDFDSFGGGDIKTGLAIRNWIIALRTPGPKSPWSF